MALPASANLVANVQTQLYQAPDAKKVVLSVNLCNRAATPVKVRLALTSGGAPTDADWLEYDTPIPPAGSLDGSTLERTGLALEQGQRVYVQASAVGVSAVAYGIEEVA